MNRLKNITKTQLKNSKDAFTMMHELHRFIVLQRVLNKQKMVPLTVLEKPESQTKESLEKAKADLKELVEMEKDCEAEIDNLYSLCTTHALTHTDINDEREARIYVDEMINKFDQLSEIQQLARRQKEHDKAIHKPKPIRNQKPVVKKPRYTKEKTDSSPHLFGMNKDEIQAHQEAREKQTEIEALKELHDLREENEQNLDLENDTNEIDSL